MLRIGATEVGRGLDGVPCSLTAPATGRFSTARNRRERLDDALAGIVRAGLAAGRRIDTDDPELKVSARRR